MMTLLKHEWLRTRGLVGTVVGLAALTVGVATLLAASGWPLLSTFGFMAGTVAVVILAPALQLTLAADYWRSSYSRTGYFTHSLPIRGGKIYAAKLSWAFVVTLAALVVSAFLLGLFWLGAASLIGAEPNPFVVLRDIWGQLQAQMPTELLIAAAILFLVMYLVWPIQYYFSASVGSEGRLNRLGLGGPVLVFFGLYLVTQVAVLVGIFAIPFGLGMDGGQVAVMSFDFFGEGGVMPLGIFPAILLIAAVCLWRTTRSWNKKVSLA